VFEEYFEEKHPKNRDRECGKQDRECVKQEEASSKRKTIRMISEREER